MSSEVMSKTGMPGSAVSSDAVAGNGASRNGAPKNGASGNGKPHGVPSHGVSRNGRHGEVYVYNKTRETFVATGAKVANSYFTRLVGLLGKTKRWAQLGTGLWIIPSRGVHTIGMLFPIDLVFLSKDKEVVHIEEYVRPFRISKVSLKATSVLELPPHTIYRSQTQVGDRFEIARLVKDEAPVR